MRILAGVHVERYHPLHWYHVARMNNRTYRKLLIVDAGVALTGGVGLILNTIRWAREIRPMDELKLPADGKASAKLKPGDLKMAAQLISNMTGQWRPEDYAESFSAAVHELVKRKIKASDTELVTPVEDASTEERSSNVIDLTELLARSLKKGKPRAAPASKKAAAKTPAGRRS